MKDDVIKHASNHVCNLNEGDFLWVITVPAIWKDAAKQFMREAAEKVKPCVCVFF